MNYRIPGLMVIFLLFLSSACRKEEKISLPVISTNEITLTSWTSAGCGGKIISDGGASITGRGICWDTLGHPGVTNDKTENGSGNGSFLSTIALLKPGTIYYVNAYAINKAGPGYGNIVSITVPEVNPEDCFQASYSILSGWTGYEYKVSIDQLSFMHVKEERTIVESIHRTADYTIIQAETNRLDLILNALSKHVLRPSYPDNCDVYDVPNEYVGLSFNGIADSTILKPCPGTRPVFLDSLRVFLLEMVDKYDQVIVPKAFLWEASLCE